MYVERERVVPVRVPYPVPYPVPVVERREPEYETYRYVEAPRRYTPSPPRVCEERERIVIEDRRTIRDCEHSYY